MNETEFANTYLQYEENIKKVLNSKKIYDEDLLHDTYIALYDHKPHPAPEEFVNTFVSFYRNNRSWQDKQESNVVPYDNAQLAALEIPDDSVSEDALNERIDCTNRTTYREQCRTLLPKVLDYYFSHPQPGERNRRRSCSILRLYLDGKSECEIARELNVSQPTVHQYFTRAVAHLKAIALILQYRGGNVPEHPSRSARHRTEARSAV